MIPTNYNDVINYLFTLRTNGTKLGLESIRYLLDLLGSPDKKCDYIHIAGTNGKGSTAVMISEILKSAGLKVGLFTSPHLTDFRERFRVNSVLASKNEITGYLKKINAVVQSMNEIDTPRKPTFFEVVTAIGVLHFAKNNCDVVVLETGMGGRLDATNAISSCASVITKISLDHTKWLGDTIEKITREKTGIIKQGSHVFTSNTNPTPLAIISSVSIDKKCRLTVISSENLAKAPKKSVEFVEYHVNHVNKGHYDLSIDDIALKDTFINLQGRHQAQNAALAAVVSNWYLKTIKHISDSKDFIKNGLKNVVWNGRCQIISKNPLVLLDCAHNPDGIKNLVHTLKEISQEKWIVVLGILNDKYPDIIIKAIAEVASEIIYIKPSSQRGLEFNKFSKIFADNNITGIQLRNISDVNDIKTFVQNEKYLNAKNIVITGSCYLIGDFLSAMNMNTRDNRTDDPVFSNG